MQPTVIGYIASFITVISFLPQVVRAWRTRSARDLSYGMLGCLILSAALWVLYGIMIDDLPIIVTNSLTFSLISAILAAKVRYRDVA